MMGNARILLLVTAIAIFNAFRYLELDVNTALTSLMQPAAPEGRILLYITTHMSEMHFWYLQACWPKALHHSSLLRNADVMVYLTAPEKVKELAIQQLNYTFKDQNNLTIHAVDNPGLQEGAMAAMRDATKNKWFDGYDWIIRLNPDVIVRNDTFLVDTIVNDPNATALLIDCLPENYDRNTLMTFQRSWKGPLMMTDFFALKPSALQPDAFLNPSTANNAEMSFTTDIREILNKGGHRIIPGAGPPTAVCRSGDGRAIEDSPIIHRHFDVETQKISCPIPFSR